VPALQKQLPELLGIRAIPAECDVKIGIATGEVLAGSIGSELMMSFTVMGDAVNLASRLEAVNKVYGSHILISQTTAAAVGDALELREIDQLIVTGQRMPQVLFEVMRRSGALTKQQELLRTRYLDGLAAYRARRWDDARNSFEAALEASPSDGPSQVLLSRIDNLRAKPPPPDWDGSWSLSEYPSISSAHSLSRGVSPCDAQG
jgi:hypothetical protein